MMKYTEYSLCQDCLKLNPIHPTNEGVCECKGDTCSCYSCQDTINKLMDGELDYKVLDLLTPISSWDAITGSKK